MKYVASTMNKKVNNNLLPNNYSCDATALMFWSAQTFL